MEMANREIYACCSMKHNGLTIAVGLEYAIGAMHLLLQALHSTVEQALQQIPHALDSHYITEWIERSLENRWPGRAYYIEVGVDDQWVQVCQPYGMPKETR